MFMELKPKMDKPEMLNRLQSLYDEPETEWHHKYVLMTPIAQLEFEIKLQKINFD